MIEIFTTGRKFCVVLQTRNVLQKCSQMIGADQILDIYSDNATLSIYQSVINVDIIFTISSIHMFPFVPRHRAMNLFLKSFNNIWLATEEVDKNILIVDLTVSSSHIFMTQFKFTHFQPGSMATMENYFPYLKSRQEFLLYSCFQNKKEVFYVENHERRSISKIMVAILNIFHYLTKITLSNTHCYKLHI